MNITIGFVRSFDFEFIICDDESNNKNKYLNKINKLGRRIKVMNYKM